MKIAYENAIYAKYKTHKSIVMCVIYMIMFQLTEK